MTNPSRHTEWLSLVEVSGPFLAVPVLEKAFPQGLDIVETPRRQHLRAAYEEWCDAVEEEDSLLLNLQREWVRLVFTGILEYDSATLKTDAGTVAAYTVASPERTESFTADWLIVSPSDGKPRLFVSIQPPGTDIEKARKDDRWPASLLERMTALCRAHGVRLGIVTDGERWMLVNAPSGATSSDASWYARLWFQEPVTLKAFQSLWGVRRCFGPADETLEALLEKSLEHHEEITDTLGEQVRRAVEVLVQCLDKADADRNRELLRDVSPAELYEAGLTVMMRLVFVLCAEERGLLLSGDTVYDECYAVSTLRGQLAEEADRHGPEVLDRRHDAWARLLSVFRAVHGGIDHESLRMPALGGSLFDPDRFPFLEGRSKGTSWRDSGATPLPIDNRTVLLLLGSLQLLEQHGGALLLSYRALDVEQIGHVYEGLLEHTVARVPSVTVGLVGSKKAKNPNLPLSEVESARMDGEDTLVALVKETSERSESAIRNALARSVDEAAFGRLLSVCGGDTTLSERIRPFANLLRTDAWDDPIVYRENAFMVTLGADRRETGTHYTPKSLTESIVKTTLEPVAYVEPADGKPREEWRLKCPAELLDLKICDPAMGSGAFLVQACRWLAERLVEAWAAEEVAGKFITADGDVKEDAGEADPMPTALDERLLTARRLIAERCLYGVDVNPLAVELAKLSIWLVTLAKGRPFGFLDHNLRHGDSLLGIHRLDQLTKLKLAPDDGPYQQRIFGQNVAGAVAEAVEIRKRLRAVPIRDIRDVETMARLDSEARKKLEAIELVADAMIGKVLQANGNTRAIDSALDSLAIQAGAYLGGDAKMGATIKGEAHSALSVDPSNGKLARKPFHWPLDFPEVFVRSGGGFDSMLGNPPFMGGLRITELLGEAYNAFLGKQFPPGGRLSDLCAFFFRRCGQLVRHSGTFGLLATNTISQGVTRGVGLSKLLESGWRIYNAAKSFNWPGKAAVIASMVSLFNGEWKGGTRLGTTLCSNISSMLDADDPIQGEPHPLHSNKSLCHEGSTIWGEEFIISEEFAHNLIDEDARNRQVVKPVIGGVDLNNSVVVSPPRWVIDMGERDFEEARQYAGPFEYLERSIYPKRKDLDPDKYRRVVEGWWKYFNARQGMYRAIEENGFRRILARCRVSDFHIIEWLPTGIVYLDTVMLFLLDQWWHYSILQSAVHEVWARRYSSTLKNDMRYIGKSCFDTFPFPDVPSPVDVLERLGISHYETRKKLCEQTNMSRGKIASKVNDQTATGHDIDEMRVAIMSLDAAVISAYGWDDVSLAHGFRQIAGRTKFFVAESASNEILMRLLKLNHERYDAQVRTGIEPNKLRRPSTGRGRAKRVRR